MLPLRPLPEISRIIMHYFLSCCRVKGLNAVRGFAWKAEDFFGWGKH